MLDFRILCGFGFGVICVWFVGSDDLVFVLVGVCVFCDLVLFACLLLMVWLLVLCFRLYLLFWWFIVVILLVCFDVFKTGLTWYGFVFLFVF